MKKVKIANSLFTENMTRILERAILQGKRTLHSSLFDKFEDLNTDILTYKLRISQDEYVFIKQNLKFLNHFKSIKGGLCWEIDDICLTERLETSYIIFMA